MRSVTSVHSVIGSQTYPSRKGEGASSREATLGVRTSLPAPRADISFTVSSPALLYPLSLYSHAGLAVIRVRRPR